ncbi:MAG TPA: hypothetical protein VGV57_04600 [Thermoleophilaceae bacterium]|nr:hypothetical protein [Thermoleophilaceae bacterium]
MTIASSDDCETSRESKMPKFTLAMVAVLALLIVGSLAMRFYGEFEARERRIERQVRQEQREARRRQRELERATDELNAAERELRRELRGLERGE